jgi:hypothetical protein
MRCFMQAHGEALGELRDVLERRVERARSMDQGADDEESLMTCIDAATRAALDAAPSYIS